MKMKRRSVLDACAPSDTKAPRHGTTRAGAGVCGKGRSLAPKSASASADSIPNRNGPPSAQGGRRGQITERRARGGAELWPTAFRAQVRQHAGMGGTWRSGGGGAHGDGLRRLRGTSADSPGHHKKLPFPPDH